MKSDKIDQTNQLTLLLTAEQNEVVRKEEPNRTKLKVAR